MPATAAPIEPAEWAYPEANYAKAELRYIIQYQINDPAYQYAGRWIDKFTEDSLEAGAQMLETARTRYADSADAYRLVARAKMTAVTTAVLPL